MTAAETLIRKGKSGAAAFVQAECMANKAAVTGAVATPPAHLQALLDHLLHPSKDIGDVETIDWCRWLVGGGQSPEDFSTKVQEYNNTMMCGLVWTANFVAYRCSTCRISQCMSLCRDCFHSGNHVAEGHDYNMFKSQAGGACDCGDSSVMRTAGFCSKHGRCSDKHLPGPPDELMCVAENMLPKLILRLLQHLREKSVNLTENPNSRQKISLEDADGFLTLLHEFCDMGSAMRNVIIGCLVNSKIYTNLTQRILKDDSEYANYMRKSSEKYNAAVAGLPSPDHSRKFCDCPALNSVLVHTTFLEELLFWTVRFEFPQKLVCLLLNMLPDQKYKELFTRAFVLHYSRMSTMLDKSGISETLSNRVIHVSVQLFSNEALTLKMTEDLHLLHIIVFSIKNMMSTVLTLNTLGDVQQNYHEIVDCGEHVMKDHCYWPLVSDLNNVLSHPSIAYKFMEDERQLSMWFDFLPMFQGMNVNTREMKTHIEFEPNTYYAAFSAELEASASPMWSLVSHLKDPSSRHLTTNVIKHCLRAIKNWFEAIYFLRPDQLDRLKMSFHLPLHRYFAVFVRQAVKYQGFSLDDLLPDTETLHLMMMHPLAVQVAFYEIMNHMWVRNGLQIRGQAMTYIQCHFSNSMADPDIFFLQLCCTRLDPSVFLKTMLDRFNVQPWLSLATDKDTEPTNQTEQEQEVPMMESALVFLVSLLTLRTNLGLSDQELTRLEMATLLFMDDRTHSSLSEQMPEKNGNGVPDDFEAVLSEVGSFREPQFEPGGVMQQGLYVPKAEIWENMYDPVYVLLRAVHRREFQNSLDRFIAFSQRSGKLNTDSGDKTATLWPPWRLPTPCDPNFTDPRTILHSRFAHGLIFNLLYKGVYGDGSTGEKKECSEQILSLTVFLLELALSIPQTDYSGKELAVSTPWLIVHEPLDLEYETWFPTNWLSANLRHTVTALFTNHPTEPNTTMEVDQVSDGSSNSDSETTPYFVETPTSEAHEGSSPPRFQAVPTSAITMSPSSSNALLPFPSGTMEHITSLVLQSSRSKNEETQDRSARALEIPMEDGEELGALGLIPRADPSFQAQQQISSSAHRSVVNISESIISLLVKLHSKLSGKPDSYTPMSERSNVPNLAHTLTQEYAESRIGDACFFIEKVLDKICNLDSACEHFVKHTRAHLWPTQHAKEAMEDLEQERDEIEARKRRAKDRQAKMMQDFAERQKRFMRKVEETEDITDKDSDHETSTIRNEYDCVHCHQSQPSTLDKPMGLVVLMQATSVLGHKHNNNEHLILPIREEDRSRLAVDDSLAGEYESRLEEMMRHFDPTSYLLSVNSGWQGGVSVQSCGHHVHLDCQQSYMESLKNTSSSQASLTLMVEKGEYMCPMCRQLANGVLPIPPDKETLRAKSQCPVSLGRELTDILKLPTKPITSFHSHMYNMMNQIMESLTKATYPQYHHLDSVHAIVMFVSSIARTNLELDLVNRGGTLLTASTILNSPLPSSSRPRTCFLPLLQVLAVHMKIRFPKPMVADWCQISGLWQDEDDRSLMVHKNEVPLLMKDPSTLLLHFTLLLPLQMDKVFFVCIVRQLYNLCWLQACLKVACRLHPELRTQLRDDWNRKVSKNDSHDYLKVDTVLLGIGLVCSVLDTTRIFNDNLDDPQHSTATRLRGDVSVDQLQVYVQGECLNYMRMASLLRHYLYNDTIPDIWEEDWEFTRLAQHLGMADIDISGRVSSGPCLGWLTAPATLCYSWCREIGEFSLLSHQSARRLVLVNSSFKQPQLLRLPKNYDSIFQFYYKRVCPNCMKVPKDPSICLLCGAMVCLKESCCKFLATGNFEAVRHSVECGAGTAPYLAVNSATIVVIRGKRACIWGSIYLDSFGEEDRELKRGKPLFLSLERYHFLESQWLTHRFDHTNRKWIWHRENL